MGITRNDLLRALPSIFDQQPFEINKDVIESKHDQGCLKIEITQEGFRNLASMKVPCLELDFMFEGYGMAQVNYFMERFLLHLHKGGG